MSLGCIPLRVTLEKENYRYFRGLQELFYNLDAFKKSFEFSNHVYYFVFTNHAISVEFRVYLHLDVAFLKERLLLHSYL